MPRNTRSSKPLNQQTMDPHSVSLANEDSTATLLASQSEVLDPPPGVDPKILEAITFVVRQENVKLDLKLTEVLVEMRDLKSKISDLEKGMDDCSFRCEKIRTDFLPGLNNKINDIASALSMHMIDIDNHSRKWSLIINGMKGEAHENQKDTRKACLDLARDHLGIRDAHKTPVAACHRLKQSQDAPVIIRFSNLDDRDDWIRQAKHLRNHPDNVSISPDIAPALRPIKNNLMNKRRLLPNDLKMKSVIKYTKSWPYVELHVNGTRYCDADISKDDIVKRYISVDPSLKFDISQ